MATEKPRDLIDRNQLFNHLADYWGIPRDWDGGVDKICEDALGAIEDAPTVDAVEVVRCKDCKSWEQYNACDGSKPHRCMNLNAIFHMRTAPDDFCSYGERRTDHV